MKLEAKLGSTYGILILAMLATSTVAYLRMTQVNRITSTVILERVPIADMNRKARLSLTKATRALEESLLYRSDPAVAAVYRQAYQDQWAAVDLQIGQLGDMVNRSNLEAYKSAMPVINTQINQLHQLDNRIETLIASQRPEDTAAAYELIRKQMPAQEDVTYATLFVLLHSQYADMHAESEQVTRTYHAMVWTLWTTTLVSSLLGGLLAMMIARRISRSLRSVVGRATAIAEGDLTGSPLGIESGDEVGLLAEAMQQMQGSLRQTIGAVAQTAASVTGNAVSIGETGREMQRKMDEQNQQTELTVAAVHEMSASTAEVSRHASSAAKSARAAAETARQGGAIVRQMLSGMNSIDQAVRSTSSTIHLLGEDSGRISHIVRVIDEIARKTNLLALNAAIEAARAGEHGRGFAVVAAEVRSLAESTAQATSEISQMIHGIQERTGQAVASMSEGNQIVATGMVTTGSAGEALEQIIATVEQVDRMIAQIAIASEQQSTSANESSSALNSIYRLGSENLRTMNISVAGAEALRNSALELEQQIEGFRTDEEPGADDRLDLTPELPFVSHKMIALT
jgi:methyl-accepting chemotaxis protein